MTATAAPAEYIISCTFAHTTADGESLAVYQDADRAVCARATRREIHPAAGGRAETLITILDRRNPTGAPVEPIGVWTQIRVIDADSTAYVAGLIAKHLGINARAGEVDAAAAIRETIREMLPVWDALTDAQRADAVASATAAADKAEAAFLAAPVDHCATCGHYQEWHSCEAGDFAVSAKAADEACELYYAERPSDLIDDGYGLRARGGLVYFG